MPRRYKQNRRRGEEELIFDYEVGIDDNIVSLYVWVGQNKKLFLIYGERPEHTLGLSRVVFLLYRDFEYSHTEAYSINH
ncbi:hypothetical protein [Candidatus Tisiphia endosymbiont of Nemotelus uliginosus]|uniref:hypothetical protein n=1 Tax=Candidatus Tisiphia endosymbiont of Nemotelus uliginosus TaxID=3077926 RepID=UPI0035C8CE4D